MNDEPWHVRRRQELEAAAPAQRKRKAQPFVKVPLWWIAEAAKATRSPATVVLAEILYTSWKTGRSTFSLPNGRLTKLGVSRKIKQRVLHDLERAQLIKVEQTPRKTPVVTLIAL